MTYLLVHQLGLILLAFYFNLVIIYTPLKPLLLGGLLCVFQTPSVYFVGSDIKNATGMPTST